MKKLLGWGAPKYVLNNDNELPLDIAHRLQLPQVIVLLNGMEILQGDREKERDSMDGCSGLGNSIDDSRMGSRATRKSRRM